MELHRHYASIDNQHTFTPIMELDNNDIDRLFYFLSPDYDIDLICTNYAIDNSNNDIDYKRNYLDKLSKYDIVAIG